MSHRPAAAESVPYRPLWDRVGIVVTAICAVHCLALPILLPVLAATDLMLVAHHEFEWVILGITFVLAAVVLTHGYLSHHRRRLPLVLAAAGVAICLVRHELGEALEPFVLMLGAGLIVGAHAMNLRFSRLWAGAPGHSHGHAHASPPQAAP